MTAIVLPGRRQVEALCSRIGVTPMQLRGYLIGAKVPAPWVAAEIARTLGRDTRELFPTVERATQRPVDVHRRAGL